jgi:predicted nucleic acid-binding protein
MILVDSSIWMDHLRSNDPVLQRMLHHKQVLSHPYIIGELAVGNLNPREAILADLSDLPRAIIATEDEVLQFIAHHELFGIRIGYINAHLLVAAQLTPDVRLWTRDKRLHAAAEKLNLAAKIMTM